MRHRLFVWTLAISTTMSPVLLTTHASAQSAPSGAARGKSATIPPPPSDDVAPTERGIKDPGVKSCGSCGMTGREAAPPPIVVGAAPSAERTGRPKERDDPARDTSRAAPGSGPNAAARNKTGWILCCNAAGKSYEVPAGTPGAVRAPDTGTGPRATAKGGKTGWILGIGGLAAIIAVVAASGSGSGAPVSS